MIKNKVNSLFFLVILLFSLTGCGSGGDSSTPTGTADSRITLSGTVQKGLFNTLNVSAYPLDTLTGAVGEPVPVDVTDQNYTVQLDPYQTLLLEATGEFLNDVTGEPVTLDEPLTVLVSVDDQDANANINLLTTIVAERTFQQLPDSTLPFDQLVEQQETFVNDVFSLPATTQPDQLDYANIQPTSTIADPNLLLLLYSAAITETLDGDQLFADGFSTLLEAVVNADTTAEAVVALDVLNTFGANATYTAVQDNSSYAFLPDLQIADSPVFLCLESANCSWQPQASPTVSVDARSIYESFGEVNVTVRLGEASTSIVKVNIATASDTATEAVDFLRLEKQLEFAPGETTKEFQIGIIIDNQVEPTEDIAISISSLTPAYSVLQDKVKISVLDGAPTTFANQTVSEMNIRSLKLPFICLASGDCGLLDNSSTLGLVAGSIITVVAELDLETLCVPTSTSSCAQQEKDWLVDFYLVAKDNADARQAEASLGSYIYKDKSVQLDTEDFNPRFPVLGIGGSDVETLAQNANNNGWTLEVEARLGAPEISLARYFKPVVLLPSSVMAGSTEIPLDSVINITDGVDAGCLQGEYSIEARYQVATIPQVGVSTQTGSLCVDLDTSDPTGNPATVVDGFITLSDDILPLPLGASIRYSSIFNSVTGFESIPYLVLSSLSLSEIFIDPNWSPALQALIQSLADSKIYLHAKGWPFELELDNVTLSAEGIVLAYKDMRYVMDHNYSDLDPRANGQLYSNDIYYSGVAGKSGTLILNPDGLQGSISVAQSGPDSANTAFPKAAVEWQSFTQNIDQNRLQPVQLDISSYTMQQATACSEPGCDGDRPQSWHVVANNVKLDGDGFMLGNAINQRADQITVFGAKANDEFAWSRPDDLTSQQTMKLALPGYIMPADVRVSDYLLAHLNEPLVAGDNLARYPLGSDAFVDGNYHPVGLSIGPEIYRNATQGIPEKGDGQDLSIGDKKLTINNGVDTPFNLISSPGVKYVLRNGGLTGVFNVAASSLGAGASPQFYGYPLNLSRFAVRATDNKLDTYTWIDGTLALNNEAGGPAGLDVWFSNMEINCAARLGNVDLLYEACDGEDNNANGIYDENCSPQLYAWKAETDIFAAGFAGADDTQACATDGQKFTLDLQLFFKALNKPVAFHTQWDLDGFLDGQSSGELPVYRFDKSDEGEGFPIKTSGAKLAAGQVDGDDYGWLELEQTKLAVPFWNAFDADVRVANQQQFAELVAEPTVVLPFDQLTAQQDLAATTESNQQLLQRTIDNDVDLDAQYSWGNTGFGFELPVYYQPWQLDSGNNDADAQGRQSRFIGRTFSKDLFVMDANAGINFVEPKRTKLSFGASADFERLGNINFQIDPTDPDSAAAVDELLISLKITSSPLLEPALTDFLDTINVINRYANRGLDEVVQQGLELAVKETGKAAAALTPNNQDPFVTASEALAMVRSGPQQAITVLADELRRPLENSLFSLEQQLRAEISNLESVVNDPQLPQAQAVAQIDKVIAIVNQVTDQAAAVDEKIDDTITRATELLSESQSRLNDLQSAMLDIDQILLQSVSFVESSCSAGFVLNAEGNGYLDKVAVRFAAVRKLADIIRNTNGMFAVAETLAKDTEQKRRINTAKRRIQEAVTELLGFVTAADNAVRNVVCAESDINDVASKALIITNKIYTEASIVGIVLVEAITPINKISSLHEKLSATIIEPVYQLAVALELARDLVADESIPVADLFTKADCILLDLTSNGSENCTSPPADYGVNTVVDQVFGIARDSIYGVINDAENKLIASLDNLLPGAFMTPQQLREMLVAEVMNSTPIKDMRTEMDKHFSEIAYSVNGIVLQYLDQLNLVIKNAIADVTGPVNDALAAASSVVREMPLQAAGIDGYATIAGNELERAHIGAAWTMRGADDDEPTEFKAALDAESWSARNKGLSNDPEDALKSPTACAVEDASSLLDVKISAYGLPIKILEAKIEIEKLYLGFTLEQNTASGPPLIPVGVFGGINTMGEIGFTDAIVIDPAFAAGLGLLQTYVGASAAAEFSDLEADVAFMVGRVCPGNTVLTDLDPDVAKFLPSMPPSGFAGAYLRGGATIPLIPGGCALNLGVGADFGSWIFIGEPTTIGGLVGGKASGEIACIASIKGQVRVAGTVNTDGDLKLAGEAWGVAGAGFDCDKGTWTSVRRSRDDDWCGTGDIQTDATFENGNWDIKVPTPSAIH